MKHKIYKTLFFSYLHQFKIQYSIIFFIKKKGLYLNGYRPFFVNSKSVSFQIWNNDDHAVDQVISFHASMLQKNMLDSSRKNN
ncbi:hypothetical protein D2U88_15525 [Flagellimonas aequoris]|uniref:Uncharacterized protein n=1 Tax=Flagellimonas aequoris TaxID=2306997 RepID=A0A418N413_9FLAO|nr:hypothetical protein D2U88_15525 [Allomuricauda aequoris]